MPANTQSLGEDSMAKKHLARNQELKKHREPWQPFWKESSRLILPPEYYDPSKGGMAGPDMRMYESLYESTAAQANLTLANGQFSHITPIDEQFFAFGGGPGVEDERAKSWLHEVSDTLFSILQTSLFSSEIYSMYLQRGAFNTSTIYCEEGTRKPLHFRTEPIGSYCISEDHERYVDTTYREFVLTTRNAVALFGEENVGEKIREAYSSERAEHLEKEWKFLQAVYPRPDSERNPRALDAKNKPWASVYIDIDSKKTVKVSGYDENPYIASRFQRHSHSAYGVGPSNYVIPEARQLNHLELSMDAVADKMAFPPILAPQEMRGRLDQRAGSVTWVPPELLRSDSSPRAWATNGNPQFGIERVDRKQKNIEALYYNDVFRLFTQMDVKGVAARAIAEQASEKLGRFQPVFSLFSIETLEPLLNRGFAICFRAGHFGDPRDVPESLLVQGSEGTFLRDLNITFSSRMALAIRARHNAALLSTMEGLAPMSQAFPELLDHFAPGTIARDYPRNEGVPSKWIEDLDTVVEKQQARAQAQQAAQEAEQQAQAADAAGKLKGADPDNLRDIAGLAAQAAA